MKIIWSPLANDRVSEIAEYIALDKPPATEKWITTLFSKVEQLVSAPKIGRVVPEPDDGPVGLLPVICLFGGRSKPAFLR